MEFVVELMRQVLWVRVWMVYFFAQFGLRFFGSSTWRILISMLEKQ
jgi:hypothetical protein